MDGIGTRSGLPSRRWRLPLFVAFALALPAIVRPAPAVASDASCANFASQAAAQRFFIKSGGPAADPNGLDPDNDGVACEDNAGPFRGLLTTGYAGSAFSGQLTSSTPCLADRHVTVFRKKAGKLVVVGKGNTDADGRYAIPRSVARGKYLAKAAATRDCVSDRSPTIAVPDRRLEIAPQGVFFTVPGETKELRATFVDDATGATTPATAAWFHSSNEQVISVTRDGTVTAVASNGSAQITVSVGGISSSPILAVVTDVADAATIVTDEEITDGPQPTDPAAQPAYENTFFVVLHGIDKPQVDQLFVGLGDHAFVGRVVSVEDVPPDAYRVTFKLVPFVEAFPDLTIDQSLDLGNAPVDIDPALSDEFTIRRTGSTFGFTERTAGGSAPAGFTEAKKPCDVTGTAGASISFKPITMSFDINPHVDFEIEGGVFHRFIIEARPRLTLESGIQATAQFSGKIECKVQLIKPKIPAPGPLGFILGAQVPIGVGLEAGGSITLANLDVSFSSILGADLRAGIECPLVSPCEFVRELEVNQPTFKPSINGHGLAGPRLEPSIDAYLWIAPSIGAHAVDTLQFTVFETHIGTKLSATFGTVTDQVTDDAYASEYKINLASNINIAPGLAELAKELKVDGFIGTPLKLAEIELARTPTGALTANHQDFVRNDRLKFKLHLFHTNFFECCGPYNVDEVVLYRHRSGDINVDEIERRPASKGQTDFTFAYRPPDAGQIDEFYAFAVTSLAPGEFEVEIARAVGYCGGVRRPSAADSCDTWPQTISGTISGSETNAGNYTATWSGSMVWELWVVTGDTPSYKPVSGSLTYHATIFGSGCTGSGEGTFSIDSTKSYGAFSFYTAHDPVQYLGPDAYWRCDEAGCDIPSFGVSCGNSTYTYLADVAYLRGDNQFHDIQNGTTIAGSSSTVAPNGTQRTYQWDLQTDTPVGTN